MKRSFVAAGAVALGALLLAVSLWWRAVDSREQLRQRTTASADTELSALRERVSSLQERLDAMTMAQAQLREEPELASAAGVPGAQPVTAPADAAPLAAMTPEQEERLFSTYFAELDRQRRLEQRDPPFQTQVETRVQEVLSGELAGSKAATVECGATLCRLEIRHGDLRSQHLFMQQFHLKLGASLPEASMYSPPGSLTTQVQLVREGHSLPLP